MCGVWARVEQLQVAALVSVLVVAIEATGNRGFPCQVLAEGEIPSCSRMTLQQMQPQDAFGDLRAARKPRSAQWFPPMSCSDLELAFLSPSLHPNEKSRKIS